MDQLASSFCEDGEGSRPQHGRYQLAYGAAATLPLLARDSTPGQTRARRNHGEYDSSAAGTPSPSWATTPRAKPPHTCPGPRVRVPMLTGGFPSLTSTSASARAARHGGQHGQRASRLWHASSRSSSASRFHAEAPLASPWANLRRTHRPDPLRHVGRARLVLRRRQGTRTLRASGARWCLRAAASSSLARRLTATNSPFGVDPRRRAVYIAWQARALVPEGEREHLKRKKMEAVYSGGSTDHWATHVPAIHRGSHYSNGKKRTKVLYSADAPPAYDAVLAQRIEDAF